MLEAIALILVVAVYKNDLRTIPRAQLAVSLGSRIFAQIAFLPVWALDIALIIATINYISVAK